MKPTVDMEYVLGLGKELIEIPSVGGDCRRAMNRVRDEFTALGLKPKETNKGALIASQPGRTQNGGRIVSAHVDTLGAVVRRIEPNGTLRLLTVGGFSWNCVEAENLLVHTADGKTVEGSLMPDKASRHAFAEEVTTMVRDDDHVHVRLDEPVQTAEDVRRLGIEVGDIVSFETRFRRTPAGFIKSRYLDDKICLACCLGAIKALKDASLLPSRPVHWYASNYEEIGHGVSVIPDGVTECLAVDIAIVADGNNSSERAVSILAKDSRTPYPVDFRHRLQKLAQAEGIPYRVDTPYRYGSDASMGALAGFDFNFAAMGPGVDASHHYERTHIDALKATCGLLMAYLLEE